MVSYGSPITPPQMGLWFNAGSGGGYRPQYNSIVVPKGYQGPALQPSGRVGNDITGGFYRRGASAGTSFPGELDGEHLATVHAAIAGHPMDGPPPTIENGVYTFAIQGVRSADYTSEHAEGVGGAHQHRLAVFPVDEFGVDLQRTTDLTWTPYESGYQVPPPGASGWRVVPNTGRIVDCWIAYQDTLRPSGFGHADPEDAARWLGLSPDPTPAQAGTQYPWDWVLQNCTSMAITTYPPAEMVDAPQVFTIDVPPEILSTSRDANKYGAEKPCYLLSAPTMVAANGMPPAHPAFDFTRPTDMGWSWTHNPNINRTGGFEVAPQVHTQYVWQPPQFQWIFDTATPAPPCRLFPRDDGLGTSSAARIFPPSKLRQRSNRPAATY